MIFKQKQQRCRLCLTEYNQTLSACPVCGMKQEVSDEPPVFVCNQMPSGTVVANRFQIGMPVRAGENSITYLALDLHTNKIIELKEFFASNRMARDGCDVFLLHKDDEPEIQKVLNRFLQTKKSVWNDYNTYYISECILSKRQKRPETPSGRWRAALRSIKGNRKNQEDCAALYQQNNGFFAVVCDGMGGLDGGELASACCSEKLTAVERILFESREAFLPQLLRTQMCRADKSIRLMQKEDGSPLSCGTTLICAFVNENRLYFTSAGDSRLYLFRANTIRQLTKDQNLFSELCEKVEKGELTMEQAESHPKREALTCYIGAGREEDFFVSKIPTNLIFDDYLLLCTDGVYRTLNDDELLTIIRNSADIEETADRLIDAICEKNIPHQDNATLILMKYQQG